MVKAVGREPLHAVLCVVAALAVTWPLVTVFGTRICGDAGDPYQTLWGMRWFHDAVTAFQNPFFTDRLYYPHGSTLVFQTFDLPSTVLVLPLWGLVPDVAVYNTAVVAALAFTIYTMSRLVGHVTGDPLIGLLAGVLFVMTPYQYAHLQGHLHLLSMGWLPLYALYLLRFSESGAPRDAALAGLALALASLASWYHLLDALVLTPAVLGYGFVAHRRQWTWRRLVRGAGLAVLVYLLVAGPLLAAMLTASAREDVTGAHDAVQFSADLQAFAYPNAAQGWSDALGAHYRSWTGNAAESAAYVGYTLLALALVGAAVAGVARAFLVAAVCGAALALGPFLHVGGRVLTVRMPYWYLERALPPIQLMGIPVRLAYVMYFGLIVAAAVGLERLARGGASTRRGWRLLAIAVPVCIAMYEYRPRSLITTDTPIPAPMRAWASGGGDWAVLDIWDSYRPMWHATVHQRPMIGGYLTRVPQRLDDWVDRQPVLHAIMFGGQERLVPRVDRALDFAWDAGPSGRAPGALTVEWSGTLTAPLAGDYELVLSANDGAMVWLDQVPSIACAGRNDEGCATRATAHLAAGAHRLRALFRNLRGNASVRLSWRPPGGAEEILSSRVVTTAAGRPGLDAVYHDQATALSGLGREGGRAALRALHVRYVVTNEVENACLQRELELPLAYRGEEALIYEVPAAE